jgi:hypothetical protein
VTSQARYWEWLIVLVVVSSLAEHVHERPALGEPEWGLIP